MITLIPVGLFGVWIVRANVMRAAASLWEREFINYTVINCAFWAIIWIENNYLFLSDAFLTQILPWKCSDIFDLLSITVHIKSDPFFSLYAYIWCVCIACALYNTYRPSFSCTWTYSKHKLIHFMCAKHRNWASPTTHMRCSKNSKCNTRVESTSYYFCVDITSNWDRL